MPTESACSLSRLQRFFIRSATRTTVRTLSLPTSGGPQGISGSSVHGHDFRLQRTNREEGTHGKGYLMGKIAPKQTFSGLRVIRFANLREKQQSRVVESPGSQENQFRGLKNFLALCVYVGDTAYSVAILCGLM